MSISEKYTAFIQHFKEHLPNPKTELNYSSPFELLVAVILSAQCTDKRVNLITPALFNRFPDPESLANTEIAEIYEYIKSCSYPNNKANHLQGMAQILVQNFNGIIPQTIEELQTLPGVGRKTANVIASVIFKKPTMAVDTHVFRVSARIGLTKDAKNPLECEFQLVTHTPKEDIPDMHHWLILHGRYTCTAKNPKCLDCGIQSICDLFSRNNK